MSRFPMFWHQFQSSSAKFRELLVTMRRDNIYAVKYSFSEKQNLLGFATKIATSSKNAVLILSSWTEEHQFILFDHWNFDP